MLKRHGFAELFDARKLLEQSEDGILSFNEYLSIAERTFEELGWVSVPGYVVRDGEDGYKKRPLGNWGELAQNPPEDVGLLKEFWYKAVANEKLLEDALRIGFINEDVVDPMKAAQVSAAMLITGEVSGVTVIDIDDVEKFKKSFGYSDRQFQKLIKSTFAVKSPKGIHLYFEYEPALRNASLQDKGVDVKNDGGLITLPPARPLTKPDPVYTVLNDAPVAKMPGKLKSKLPKKGDLETALWGNPDEKEVELSPQEVELIIDSLFPFWQEGYRHKLTISLIGWLMKNSVKREQIEQIIQSLAIKAGDRELNERVRQVEYHFTRRAEMKDRLLGWKGIEDVIYTMVRDAKVSEQAALDTLEALQSIFRDREAHNMFIRLSDYPRSGIANLQNRLSIWEWRNVKGRFSLTRKLINVWIREVEYTEDYFGEEKQFVVRGIAETGEEFEIAGNAKTIAAKLRRNAWVAVRQDRVEAAINQILVEFQKRGLVKRRIIPIQRGIFPKKDRTGLMFNLPGAPEVADRKEVKKALEILDRFVVEFSARKIPHVSTTIKFAIAAPFYFARKVLTKRPYRYLFLIGERDTAKTSDMKLCHWLWGEDEWGIVPMNAVSTLPRLGRKLGESTFPIIVDEAERLFPKDASRDDIRLLIKTTWSGVIAHSYFTNSGEKITRYALSAMGFTANYMPHLRPPELKRIKVVAYPKAAKTTKAEQKAFSEFMNPDTVVQLAYIGRAIAELPQDWLMEQLLKSDDFEDFGQAILERLYQDYLGTTPDWIYKNAPEVEDEIEDGSYSKYDIAAVIVEKIKELAREARIDVQLCDKKVNSLECIIEQLEQMKTTLPLTIGEWKVHGVKQLAIALRQGVLDWLKAYGIEIPSLRDLAENLGGEFKKVTIRKRNWNGLHATLVPIDLFMPPKDAGREIIIEDEEVNHGEEQEAEQTTTQSAEKAETNGQEQNEDDVELKELMDMIKEWAIEKGYSPEELFNGIELKRNSDREENAEDWGEGLLL